MTFLIYLHGGPGFTSLEACESEESPFYMLERDMAVVYWEQRRAGTSQGNCNYDELVLAQYTEDLEKLFAFLEHCYETDLEFFLIGHSWGGALGVDFLAKPENQGRVSGWIDASGGHNVPLIAELERQMVIVVGARQIAANTTNADKWRSHIEQAAGLDLTEPADVFEMNRLARKSEDLMRQADSVNKLIDRLSLADYFFSPLDLHAMPQNGERTIAALRDAVAKLDRSAALGRISIPVLMLWGRYDFRVPPAYAEAALAAYAAEDKTLLFFERSAHFAQWQEPAGFYEAVHRFIQARRK